MKNQQKSIVIYGDAGFEFRPGAAALAQEGKKDTMKETGTMEGRRGGKTGKH